MKKITSLMASLLILTSSATGFYSSAASIKGDINADGKLNGADLTALSDFILGTENIELNTDSADMNGDGVLDVYDLTLMRQSIVKTERIPDFSGITDQFFSGYTEALVKVAGGNIETNDSCCVARSVEEMDRYLSVFYEGEVIETLNERYDDEFFKHSVLIMNSLFQSFGSRQSIEIHSVDYKDGMINVSVNPTDYADTEEISSALLIHIAVSKEDYLDFPVKWTMKESDKPVEPPQTNKKIISVQNILQNPELPTGCEVTSLTILLNHFGYNINKVALSRNFLPKLDFYWSNGVYYGADFRTTFAGDPESQYSYGCYAPCIVTTANSYFADVNSGCQAYDMSGADFDSLLTDYIDKDLPVLIWITSSNLHESSLTSIWTTPDGETVQWRAYEHCVVLTGYDKDKQVIYVSDPLVGNTSYNYDKIKQRYNELGKQAVYIK